MNTKRTVLDKSGYVFETFLLDSSLLVLQEDELLFFKEQTGITDNQKLREHILRIQAEAYNYFPYPCIRIFTFTTFKISQFPEYDYVLQLGRRKKKTILLDVGCCFGNDIRIAIAHGYPMQSVVAFDLRQGFWDLGHKLFKSTPEIFPVPFIQGDILDSTTLSPSFPSYSAPITDPPPLHHLGNSLNGLRHHVSIIHVSAFFHLFSEDQQLQVARNLAALLSPLPGSIILGSHVGLPNPGIRPKASGGQETMFCHSPESWRSMWDGVVFRKASVHVRAVLADNTLAGGLQEQKPDSVAQLRASRWMSWSVKRV